MKRWWVCGLLWAVSSSALAVEVLASVRPLALIAQAVVREPAQVRQLLPDGMSVHHPSLRPSDRKALLTADIVLRVGPAHDAFLDRVLAARKGPVVNAQTLPGIQLLRERARDGAALAKGHVDPHLWLQPDNAVVIAKAVAEALAAQDTAHAAEYRQRAQQFAEHVAAMKSALRATPRPYVAYHDAYQYLDGVLALQFRGSLTADAESKPGARHFQWMATRLATEKIPCLLAELGYDAALVARVAGKSALRVVAVDEMLTTAAMNAQGYLQGFQQLAADVARCTAPMAVRQ